MAKFAEKLTILQAANEILLDRVYYAKKVLAGKPLLSSEKLKKIHDAVDKSFPDIPSGIDKISGFELLKARTDELVDEFQPHYLTLLDVLEFKQAALELLKDISDSTVALKFDENAELMLAFMNLVVGFSQLNILVGTIPDRKMLVVLYATAYRMKESFAEASYSKIALYLQEYDQPIRKMQDELAPLSSRVGETLMNLVMTYNKCNSTSVLRKEGALSLTLVPDKMTYPVHDHFRFELVYMSRFYLWIVYGFLLCPSALQVDGAIDLLKISLQDGWVTSVFRDESMSVHQEFDNLFGWYKLAVDKKWKKNLAEYTTAAVSNSGLYHKDRRGYLKQELAQLVNLITDRPGLLGPKIQIVYAALSLASDEVCWYVRHLNSPPPKSKGKYQEEHYRDVTIVDLIYYIDKLYGLVLKHKKVIQQYYIEYLNGPDYDRVKEALTATTQRIQLDAGVSKILKAVVDGLKEPTSTALDAGKTIDLEPLRLNWFRVIAILSSVQSSVRLVQLKDLVFKTQLAISHSRNVDRIEKVLRSFSTLNDLYYFPKEVDLIFNNALEAATQQSYHVMSLVNMMQLYPANATRALPDERLAIGSFVVTSAEERIKKICLKIANLVEALVSPQGLGNLHDQAEPQYAAIMIQLKQSKQSVPYPGLESRAAARATNTIKSLRYWEMNLISLCSAIRDCGDVIMFDHLLSPIQYLREALQAAFQNFILRATLPQDVMVPLSIVMKHVNTYIAVLKIVERVTGISTTEICRKAFLTHFFDKSVQGPQGQLDALRTAPSKEAEGMLIHRMAIFYADLIDKRIAASNGPVAPAVYSPVRQSFLSASARSEGFSPENYLEINELRTLAELVGPWGVRVIDNAILRNCFRHVQNMKQILAGNKEALEAMKKAFPKEPATSESIRKVKSMDQFVQHCVALGLNLHFRDLLHKGLSQANMNYAPFIHELASDMHSVLPLNMFGDPELLSLDCMALDAGVSVKNSDPALHLILKAHNTSREDQQRLELLPYMFTALFTTPFMQQAKFRVASDAYLNNAHALALAMHEMLITLQAPTYAGDTQGLAKLAASERTFVEVASTHLIRTKLGDSKSDMNSLWIFMDVYIQTTDLVTPEALSQYLPYGLVRASYLYLHMMQKKGVSESDEGDDKATGEKK